MPGWLQPVSWVFPMTYYVDAVRGLMLKGVKATTVLHDFAWLVVFLVVFAAASLIRLRRRPA